MSLPSYLRSVAAKFFHRSLLADEMEEELRSHIQHRADDLERSGMPRAEAERRARIEFGNRDKFRQESYEALGGNFIESILQDIRLGVRVLRKSPGFTLTAIITLALAIGANSVVFSVLDALVLRPVNVPHGKNLYMIQQGGYPSQSYLDYLDLRDRNHAFKSMVLYSMLGFGAGHAGALQVIRSVLDMGAQLFLHFVGKLRAMEKLRGNRAEIGREAHSSSGCAESAAAMAAASRFQLSVSSRRRRRPAAVSS